MNKTLSSLAALPLLFVFTVNAAGAAMEAGAGPSAPHQTARAADTASAKHRIKVEFNTAAETNVTQYYALDAATLRKAQLWLAEQKTQPTAGQFADWLADNAGQLDRDDGPARIATSKDGTRTEEWYRDGRLDRADGPAFILTYTDGAHYEQWYRDGQLDRADGPARIATSKDGTRTEEWYRKGQLDRADGPAWIETSKDGAHYEQWYRAGKRDRADGPAAIETFKNGTRREAWYRADKFIKEGKTAPPISIPGVTIDPPPPSP